MKKYKTIKMFLTTFFGTDADAYGETYSEIVDTATGLVTGLKDDLSDEVCEFLHEYPDNESATLYLNKLTDGQIGDVSFLHPSPVEFLQWLSSYLKQKRDNHHS
ncbi:hypothetical protein [Serratia sp. UGAL515B_01]|uniref:hypothetical protein n=1 Tax=Serratia sp. UGAL515B_01 TaxID=2986763 RepID=UPI0029544C36|nr:hypothetical protein [Serratia sp. UGAL515B_01]WON77817.1 hypothetical protein OK023_03790 [Serratia sp. UGAL515B_01]